MLIKAEDIRPGNVYRMQDPNDAHRIYREVDEVFGRYPIELLLDSNYEFMLLETTTCRNLSNQDILFGRIAILGEEVFGWINLAKELRWDRLA